MIGSILSVQPCLALSCLLAACIALGGTGCATASRATTSALSASEPIAEAAPAPESKSEPAPARVTRAKRPKVAKRRPAPAVKAVKAEPRTPVAARAPELRRPPPESLGAGEPVAFEPGAMTRPQRVSGREPQLTPEARAERVRGTALVRCVVTREGRVTNCRLLNGLPYMERELLEAVSTWRVTPITSQGKALDVDYTFVVRIPTG